MNKITRTDYLLNKLCRPQDGDDNLVASFMPCERAAIRRKYTTLYAYNYTECPHRILETCKLQRIPYFTCIEYRANVECVERHVCDIFPVHIGLRLDRQIYAFLYGDDELNSPAVQRTMYDLYGTIFVVSPQYFSNIFTNRKEIIHSSRDSDKLYNIYMYDVHDRGHRIWMTADANKTCIFRNSNGQEHVIETSQSFRDFIDGIEYEVDIRRHMNFERMFEAFARYQPINDIDDLSNKNILCCVNLLQRGLKYAQRNPLEVAKIFRFGSLDKFASRNITYHQHDNNSGGAIGVAAKNKNNILATDTADLPLPPSAKRNKTEAGGGSGGGGIGDYTNLAQNYKTLSPTNLIHSIESYDRHIKRPVPKNVHTIPTGTEFFICLADTQLNVNSPHKWLRLLPNVILTNHLNISLCPGGVTSLNHLLDILVKNRLIQCADTDADNLSSLRLLLVNGGLPTRYVIAPDIDNVDFFFVCKTLCPLVECILADTYIVLSLSYGVPMRPVSMYIVREFWSESSRFRPADIGNDEASVIYLSPLDMKNAFLQPLRQYLYGNLLGGGCPENMRKYFKYSIPAKVHSVYTFNNRFVSNAAAVPYYDLTSENSFVYLNSVYRCEEDGTRTELLDRDQSTLSLKTIYSSDPHLTCDGYILSDRIKMDTLLKQKCRFEFELHTKTDKLMWCKDLPSFANTTNGQIRVYDAYNNCIKTYYQIFTLVRYSKLCLRYKLFNQAKISLFCHPFADGWIYRLYKYYDEEAFIKPDASYEMSVVLTTPVDRKLVKNVSIMICTSCRQPEQYSGQKLYEICGQKGLCVRQSTQRFQDYYRLPQAPDLVVSLFSAIGRTPIMTLKTMLENLTPDEQALRERILCGDCEYVVLKNVSSLFCSYGNMRVDISLVKIFLANNLNQTIYLLQQDEKNCGRVLPKSFCDSLGMYGLIKVNFIMCDEFGKEYNVFVNTFKENRTVATRRAQSINNK